MQGKNIPKKVVLAMAGHDPSGAAGIQADIESIAAAGCHAVTIITALTAQNTASFQELVPQQSDNFRKQCLSLLSDITIDACKIGLLGNLVIATVISEILDKLDVPVVLDPIIKAGTGKLLTTTELSTYISRELLHRVRVLTPNCAEARSLTGCKEIYQAGEKLLEWGCPHVLITGADEETIQVTNILFTAHTDPVPYQWERLPGTYHGSGCTLSSSIAAFIAQGNAIKTAIEAAQEYTWKTLKYGCRLGHGQIHPNRFHNS
ncbi:MAG: Phos pyr kin protein [Gammaproteobacteria bacterium]|nr:Phos pyr kin protein [Gammaproteobacteria bacterium]